MKLCDAAVGKTMVGTNVHMCKKEKDRLFYLGIYPGMQIRKLRSAPMQDPCLYFAAGNQLILRNKDAACIEGEVLE